MSLEVTPTAIAEVKLLWPKKIVDSRGFLSEVYKRSALESAGILFHCLQENHLFSSRRGTIRGLHFQCSPCAQDKLVRVVRGTILDVAVDLRKSSPTFGRHVAVELSADNWHQLFIPKGFAHGLCTLEPDTEVLYKASSYYAPECDRGLRWNDPDLGIDWPVDERDACLSDADQAHPRLRDLSIFFD